MTLNEGESFLTILTKKVKSTLYYKFVGKVYKKEIGQLEEIKSIIQAHPCGLNFILDFSNLDDFIHPAIRQFILIQMEARKKGTLYVLICNAENIRKFKIAGAVRETELVRDKNYLSYLLSVGKKLK